MLLSSDGTRIVLCEKDTTSLELWDRAAGGMIGKFEFPQSPLQPQYAPMAMSDDHRWILAGESKGMGNLNAGGAMYVFDTIRGTLAAKLDVSMISGAQIVMLPDNKTVVLLGGGLQGTQKKLYTYDLSQLTTD